MPGSKFLTIPGELRNRIYEAILTDEVTLEEDNLPRLVHRKTLECSPAPAQTEEWNGKRKAYSLTQVCRQIRKEFLTLYRQSVKVCINMGELQDYIAGVIRPVNTDPKAACGNISICFNSPCTVDVQDIITLHNCAPNLHLSYPQDMASHDIMSVLLNPHQWPKFHAYIAEKAKRVLLVVAPDKPLNPLYDDALVICPGPVSDSDSDDDYAWSPEPRWLYPYASACQLHIKEGFTESWMYEVNSNAWWKKRSDWLSGLGLAKSDRVRYRFSFRVQRGYEEVVPASIGADSPQ